MIKKQLKDFIYCLACGLCGGAFFGILCGFYDYQGAIYFNYQGARNMFLIFFIAIFCACLIEKIKTYNNK